MRNSHARARAHTAVRRLMFISVLIFCFAAGVAHAMPLGEANNQSQARPFKVEVTGHGRPMILIPGLSSSGEVWASTVARYKKNYECHVLTLAGFAGEPPVKAPFLEKVRQGIVAYIREKKLRKPVIVGHSLGGFLTLWLASSEPDLVGPIIVVDGLPFLPAASIPNATVETVKPQAEQMRQGMLIKQTPEQRQQMQAMIFGTMISDPANIQLATKWGLASDQETVAQGMYELFTTDLRDQLDRIKVPALVIGTWVGLQQYTTREGVEKIFRDQYSKLAGYQFVMSEKGKHFVMLDDPDTLFRAMDDFLAKHKGRK